MFIESFMNIRFFILNKIRSVVESMPLEEILFGFADPLPPHQYESTLLFLARLTIVINGEYAQAAALDKQVKEFILSPTRALFTLRHGWAKGLRCSPGYTGISIVFRENFTRFVYIHLKKNENIETTKPICYHTALPLTAAGRYILQILDSVAYSAYYRNNKAISLIYALLYELIDQLEHASIDHGKAELTFQTVEEYICQNYHLPIGREDISTALGLNPSYLSRLFQRFAKTTIHKHLIRLRMGKAIFLLLESNLTIKEIALRCGFEDSNYFIRVFKAWHGITPSKLRTTSKLRN